MSVASVTACSGVTGTRPSVTRSAPERTGRSIDPVASRRKSMAPVGIADCGLRTTDGTKRWTNAKSASDPRSVAASPDDPGSPSEPAIVSVEPPLVKRRSRTRATRPSYSSCAGCASCTRWLSASTMSRSRSAVTWRFGSRSRAPTAVIRRDVEPDSGNGGDHPNRRASSATSPGSQRPFTAMAPSGSIPTSPLALRARSVA